ncbi:MAG: hypothetical protein OEW11_02005 [Nitrospirota bacterium]|nr:hypothetical protein [Nitrospirota bacterium]
MQPIPITRAKAIVLVVAGTLGGGSAGIPVWQSVVQAGSFGFLISLAVVIAQFRIQQMGIAGRGSWERIKWLTLAGALWGGVVGALTSRGMLVVEYGVKSVTYGSHYPRNNTFGLLVEGVQPDLLATIVTGVFVAVALGLAFGMLKEEDHMWFLIPWAVPLGWWTGAESLAIGQALGYLNWEFIGPAQTQGMRFGIPWMECMIISRWALMRSTGELQALRARIKAADDAKWAAARQQQGQKSEPS